jgi:hypothetical protein
MFPCTPGTWNIVITVVSIASFMKINVVINLEDAQAPPFKPDNSPPGITSQHQLLTMHPDLECPIFKE